MQADTWTDGWIGGLDRSTINNAFSFSHHYHTTHFAGHSTDVNLPFSLFALEVILSAAFGMQADIQSNPDSDTVEKAKNVFRTPLWMRAFSMFPFSDYFSKKLSLSPLNHTDYFIRMARVIYDARKAQKTPSRKDLLQLMLEAQKQEIEGKRMSDEEISAQSVIFMVAGFETTGSMLSYMAYLLAAHPEVQEKLLQELDKAVKTVGTCLCTTLLTAWIILTRCSAKSYGSIHPGIWSTEDATRPAP